MLDVLRRNASGWIAKILIGLLVLSFAIWGVADMITGVGRSTVATVGPTKIDIPEFQRSYQNAMDAIAQRFGRRFTPEEAKRLFRLDQDIINRLIATAAIDNEARTLNLGITDKAVITEVQKDPAFRGVGGTFSQEKLDGVLQRIGYTQDRYLEERRKDTVRGQLTDALLQNLQPPKSLLDLMQSYAGETRIVQYMALDPKTAKIKEPTDDDIKKLYEQHKTQFMTPEFRKIEVLMLTAADARKQIPVSDEELQKAYKRDKELFAVPEKRHILQMPVKDEADGNKARAEILAGKSFEEVAKARGAKPTDIDLGTLTQKEMLDQKIAKAAFSLEAGKVSDVVKGDLSTVLLMVKTITQGNQPKFEEIKDKLRERIQRQRSSDQIRKLLDSVDDNRLAGKSLKEIGTALKLTYHAVEALDRAGNKPDGKPAFKSNDLPLIVRTAFQGEVGVDNQVVELSDGGYAWVNLIAVTPPKQKPLKEVRDAVKTMWDDDQRRDAMRKLATELVDKLKKGETFEAVAKSVGVEVKKTPAFKRGDRLPQLSPAVVTRVFALPKDQPIAVATVDGKSRMIVEVAEVKAAPQPTEEALKKARSNLQQQMQGDVIAQYVAGLRKEQGVTINQQVIDRTMGIAPTGQ
jgi:peptidyl-prolyl cis-trans isomerase D